MCISLIFKPLRHHMKSIFDTEASLLEALWVPTLDVIRDISKDDSSEDNPISQTPAGEKMALATNELTADHLRNVIMVLASLGVLKPSTEGATDSSISSKTWSAIEESEYLKKFAAEWKSAAGNPSAGEAVAGSQDQEE